MAPHVVSGCDRRILSERDGATSNYSSHLKHVDHFFWGFRFSFLDFRRLRLRVEVGEVLLLWLGLLVLPLKVDEDDEEEDVFSPPVLRPPPLRQNSNRGFSADRPTPEMKEGNIFDSVWNILRVTLVGNFKSAEILNECILKYGLENSLKCQYFQVKS